MSSDDDARVWLRAKGHSKIADQIDQLLDDWRRKRTKTRRNWWDVLAATFDGKRKTVGGIEFPILAAARARKGWHSVDDEIATGAGESAPQMRMNTRWTMRRKKPSAKRARAKRDDTVRRTAKPKTRQATSTTELSVKRFAQLEDVVVPLRDLVVLVGPQATGKSLVLEFLKLVIDRRRIVRSLKQHGFNWKTPKEFSALYFGGGFENSWTANTRVTLGAENITLKDLAGARAQKGEDAVFYIPAHRTLAIAEGWPRSFAAYQVETPYVARRFSEELLTALNQGLGGKGTIFPHDRRLKDSFRQLINDAVFHGGTLKLHTLGMRKQFVLEYGDSEDGDVTVPFMAWTAGQREFTPLLLGLYHLLPPGGGPKKKEIQWAILEEPEMGLHPKAVVAVMAVVLDLLARGYKVALSTHSPTVLEVVWGMTRLKGMANGPARLCKMMGLPEKDKKVLKTAADALKRSYAVVHVQHESNGRVASKDISNLDPGANERREWEWGGLTGFSARVSDAITRP